VRDPQIFKRLQQRRLFVLHRAAAYQHWSGALRSQRSANALHNGRWRREIHVKLEIARYLHALGSCTNRLQPRFVFLGLRQEEINLRQHPPECPAKTAVVRPRSIGDARVDHSDARPAGVRQPQKIWPEFSFCQHHQLWPQGSQIWADRKPEVHREVEHVLFAKALARELLSGIGRSGDQDPVLGERPPHLLDQPAHSQHFANRHRMHPDHPPRARNASRSSKL
jgi:hypothetical protein